MKSILIFALLFIVTTTTVQSQDFKTLDHDIMSTNSNSTDLACQLTDSKLVERKNALQKEIFSMVDRVEELNDGYLFHFEDVGGLLPNLFHYILAEKECCPFFRQDVSINPNGSGISWKISGKPGVKDILAFMLEEAGLTGK